MIIEEEVVLYSHDCKEMGCRVLKLHKEPCQFCGTNKWKKVVKKFKKNVYPIEKQSDEA